MRLMAVKPRRSRPVRKAREKREDSKRAWYVVARRLTEIEAHLGIAHGPPGRFSDGRLAAIADRLYRSRRRREAHFKSGLFGEPAWDMMLDLFINKVRGRKLWTTSLCIAAGVPQTTALRYIAVLEQAELVQRAVDPQDRRVVLVDLTASGFTLMRDYLAESIYQPADGNDETHVDVRPTAARHVTSVNSSMAVSAVTGKSAARPW